MIPLAFFDETRNPVIRSIDYDYPGGILKLHGSKGSNLLRMVLDLIVQSALSFFQHFFNIVKGGVTLLAVALALINVPENHLRVIRLKYERPILIHNPNLVEIFRGIFKTHLIGKKSFHVQGESQNAKKSSIRPWSLGMPRVMKNRKGKGE